MKSQRYRVVVAAVALVLAMSVALQAQPVPQYELSARNPVLDGTTYRFDLYVKRIGGTNFRMGNSQFVMTFNTGAFTNPSVGRIASTEQIGSGYFFDAVITGNQVRISLGGNHSYAAAADIATGANGTLVSTFEITGVSVPVVSAGLAWVNLPALVRTGVSEIDVADNYRDITDVTGASHVNGGGEFGTISGYKFEDLDGDGTWDQPAEPPLDGWKIYIAGPNGLDSAITGAAAPLSGSYTFNNLTPGSYTIVEQNQAGWSPTIAPASPFVLAAGANSANNNFGNFNGPTARGVVFRDINGDGVKDPSEPFLQGWPVEALHSSGPEHKTQLTNALGEFVFTFTPLESGLWGIFTTPPPGWVQTLPPAAGYTVDIESGANPAGLDFGLFHASSISGTVFTDINGDSLQGPGEAGTAGWLLTLTRNSSFFDSVRSGVDGAFLFDSLPSGTYVLSGELPSGWTRTLPGLPPAYTFAVDTSGNAFSASDFGNFRYGTMSGQVYFDTDHDGTKDPAEAGMSGVEIVLTGPKTSRSVTSGLYGVWSVNDLLGDVLTVTETRPAGYLLTQPAGGSYVETVVSGSVFNSLYFGNSSSTDSVMYRTMTYDSLIDSHDRKGKSLTPEKRKPDKVEFTLRIPNNTGKPADGLLVRLRIPVYYEDTLYHFVVTPTPETIEYSNHSQNAFIQWAAPIPPDSAIHISAWGSKPKQSPDSYHHWYSGGIVLNRSTPVHSTLTFLAYRLPSPNRMNVIEDIFKSGAIPTGVLVGVDRSDLKTYFAWARIRTLNNFKRSIFDRYIAHTVTPNNFYQFDNKRRMTGEQKKVSPRYHNNLIFANALTLKMSITASQLSIFPPGLGELIFESGSNPLSGKTVGQISRIADTLLTVWPGKTTADYRNLDSTLKMINASFEGRIDTFSFAGSLRLKGTRPLSAVPFLRSNPGMEPVTIQANAAPVEAVPENFALYQNYPNPFNPTTTLAFNLPRPAIVTLRIYNVLGAEVGTVLNGEALDEGPQEFDFQAGSLPSGIYFYRLVARMTDGENGENGENGKSGETLTETKKMILVK